MKTPQRHAITLVAAAILASSAAAAPKFAWVTSTPGGAEPGKPMDLIHSDPHDLTDYDFYLSCIPANKALYELSVRTRGLAGYRSETLEGKSVEVTLDVDGGKLPPLTAKLTEWDHGLEARADDPGNELLAAMEKGKTVAWSFGRAKGPKVALDGFAGLSQTLRKHCGIAPGK